MKAINFYPYIWPLTFNNDIDLLHMWLRGIYLVYSQYEVSIISCSKVKGYIKFVNFEFNWLLTFKDDLDLDKSPTQNMHLYEIHVQAKYEVSICNVTKVMALIVWKLLIFTQIFDLWPLMMTLTFYICVSVGFTYTYIPNMKSLSSLV